MKKIIITMSAITLLVAVLFSVVCVGMFLKNSKMSAENILDTMPFQKNTMKAENTVQLNILHR